MLDDPGAGHGRAPVREVHIDASHAGQRIDNFLHTALKGVPRGHVYRILRRGEVRVNRGRIRQHYRLRLGDVVRIPPIRLRVAPSVEPGNLDAALLARLEARVIHEDSGLIALDKPAGVAVHGGSGISAGVIEALRALRSTARYLELVHRLDRETSGILLVAKKRSVLTALHLTFRESGMVKDYRALVANRMARPCTVKAPLYKNTLRSGERVVRVRADGKAAATSFEPLGNNASATYARVRPHTGRTHQIRVHAAHAGFPIAGDPKYGSSDFNQRMRGLGLRRLFLHAHSLRFVNPSDQRELLITAPLPDALAHVLETLGISQ